MKYIKKSNKIYKTNEVNKDDIIRDLTHNLNKQLDMIKVERKRLDKVEKDITRDTQKEIDELDKL